MASPQPIEKLTQLLVEIEEIALKTKTDLKNGYVSYSSNEINPAVKEVLEKAITKMTKEGWSITPNGDLIDMVNLLRSLCVITRKMSGLHIPMN